jgi:hypothetical protein
MEFQREQRVAFALAGTVALPSPFPAAARVLLGIYPVTTPRGDLYLKLIHVASETSLVTRIIWLEDVRGIRVPPKDETGELLGLHGWPLLLPGEVREAAEETKAKAKPSDELELYRRAIIYVPEAAPVVTRFEFGMTAAESSEADWWNPPKCGPRYDPEVPKGERCS